MQEHFVLGMTMEVLLPSLCLKICLAIIFIVNTFITTFAINMNVD